MSIRKSDKHDQNKFPESEPPCIMDTCNKFDWVSYHNDILEDLIASLEHQLKISPCHSPEHFRVMLPLEFCQRYFSETHLTISCTAPLIQKATNTFYLKGIEIVPGFDYQARIYYIHNPDRGLVERCLDVQTYRQ